ncbi:MAG: hypothetical protein H6850_03455 [Alphaproteobacteria bacterium]|nr:MAG: hypothetical protein H6850_03455 [Alphaproteobacteria bacterium]
MPRLFWSNEKSIFSIEYNPSTGAFSPSTKKQFYGSSDGLFNATIEPIQGIAIHNNNRLFWAQKDPNGGEIFSAKIKSNGDLLGDRVHFKTNNQTNNNIHQPSAITISGNRLFWINTDANDKAIYSAEFNPDTGKIKGTETKFEPGIEIIEPINIAVDEKNKRLYWIDKGGIGGLTIGTCSTMMSMTYTCTMMGMMTGPSISSANFDESGNATNPDTLGNFSLQPLNDPFGLILSPLGESDIFWGEKTIGAVFSGEVDDNGMGITEQTTTVFQNLNNPLGIAIDSTQYTEKNIAHNFIANNGNNEIWALTINNNNSAQPTPTLLTAEGVKFLAIAQIDSSITGTTNDLSGDALAFFLTGKKKEKESDSETENKDEFNNVPDTVSSDVVTPPASPVAETLADYPSSGAAGAASAGLSTTAIVGIVTAAVAVAAVAVAASSDGDITAMGDDVSYRINDDGTVNFVQNPTPTDEDFDNARASDAFGDLFKLSSIERIAFDIAASIDPVRLIKQLLKGVKTLIPDTISKDLVKEMVDRFFKGNTSKLIRKGFNKQSIEKTKTAIQKAIGAL